MWVTVLTAALAAAAPAPRPTGQIVGVALCVAAAAIVPSRRALAETMHRLPEYRVLVEASRTIAARTRRCGPSAPSSRCRRQPIPSSCIEFSAGALIQTHHARRSFKLTEACGM